MRILNFYDFLSEGLIKSQHVRIVLRKLVAFRSRMEYEVDDLDSNAILITVSSSDWDDSAYTDLTKLINLLGWFVSNVNIILPFGNKRLDLDNVNAEIKKYKNNLDLDASDVEVSIVVEKKFEDPERSVLTQDGFLYHITEERFVKRIIKNGLVPKDKIKLSWHPARVYLATFDGLKRIRMKYCNFVDKPVILKIDPEGLVLYEDPNLKGSAFYVMDNIAPSRITVTDLDLGCHGKLTNF